MSLFAPSAATSVPASTSSSVVTATRCFSRSPGSSASDLSYRVRVTFLALNRCRCRRRAGGELAIRMVGATRDYLRAGGSSPATRGPADGLSRSKNKRTRKKVSSARLRQLHDAARGTQPNGVPTTPRLSRRAGRPDVSLLAVPRDGDRDRELLPRRADARTGVRTHDRAGRPLARYDGRLTPARSRSTSPRRSSSHSQPYADSMCEARRRSGRSAAPIPPRLERAVDYGSQGSRSRLPPSTTTSRRFVYPAPIRQRPAANERGRRDDDRRDGVREAPLPHRPPGIAPPSRVA